MKVGASALEREKVIKHGANVSLQFHEASDCLQYYLVFNVGIGELFIIWKTFNELYLTVLYHSSVYKCTQSNYDLI